MTTTSAGELVELIEGLLVRQQLNLWEISHSDENLWQHVTELKSQMCDMKRGIFEVGQHMTDAAQTDYVRFIDKKHQQILHLIERTAFIHNIKLYELIESRIELKNHIEELKEHRRLIEIRIKCETDDANDGLHANDVAVNGDLFRPSVKPKRSRSRKGNKKNVSPRMLRKPKDTLRAQVGLDTKDVSAHQPAEHDRASTKPQTEHKCIKCNKILSSRRTLRTHWLIHKGREKFECSQCNKVLLSGRTLATHMLIHNGTKSFECIVCKQLFYTKERLKNHMDVVHWKPATKSKHECEFCGRMFASQYYLKEHSLTHASTGEMHECAECKKVYASPVLLRNHMRHMHTHSDDLMVTCEICHKTMPARRYKPHKSYVHQDKWYKCELCERMFKTRDGLAKHAFKHTGKRPFQCEFCGKGFISHNILMAHRNTHTGEKPYGCQYCERKFSNLAYVRTHMKTVHKDVKRE